jgi:hypothetical protein
MGEPPVRLAQYRGEVECRRESAGPLGLTLTGRSAERPGEELQLAFAAAAPHDLPARLEDALIERTATGEYRIAAGAREWRLTAAALHVHRNVGAAFYRAIPGRPAPLTRRLLYRVVIALARSRAGLALLRAARR